MESISLMFASYCIDLLAGYVVKTNKFEESTQYLSVLCIVVVRGVYPSMYGSVTERESEREVISPASSTKT